jgi:hypothetical protein
MWSGFFRQPVLDETGSRKVNPELLKININTGYYHPRVRVFIQTDIIVVLRIRSAPWAPDKQVLELQINAG